MEFVSIAPAKVYRRSFNTSDKGKFVNVSICVNDTWYNKVTRPYSIESSLQSGNVYNICLAQKDIVAKKDFKRKDGSTVKAGETYKANTFFVDYASIKVVNK